VGVVIFLCNIMDNIDIRDNSRDMYYLTLGESTRIKDKEWTRVENGWLVEPLYGFNRSSTFIPYDWNSSNIK